MTDVLALVTVLMGAMGLSVLARVRFIHALPTVVLSITFALYLSYIAGFLHPAWWAVVTVSVAAGLAGFVERVRRGSLADAMLPSAPVISMLVAVALVAYFTAGRHVAGHDELRLWGASPKLMFFDGQLLVGPDSLLMGEMQTYTPGLPLFDYFTVAFGTRFADAPLFFATGLFTVALLCPLSARVSWQRPAGIVIAGIAMALLPLAFANHLAEAGADFYSSLFSDPVVGVALGYLVWLAIADTDRTSLWSAQFGLALAGLYLVKTPGLGLGLIVLCLALGRWIRASRGQTWRSRVTQFLSLTGPLSIAVSTWTLIQTRLGPPSKFDADGLAPTIDFTILHQYAAMLWGRPEYASAMGMFNSHTSFVLLDAALLVVLGCLVIVHRGGRAKLIVAAIVTLLSCQIVFLAGIYVLIVGPFDGRLLSFPRYTATMLTATSVLLALVAATEPVPRPDRSINWARALACTCLAFLVLSFPLRAPITFIGGWELASTVQADKLRTALDRADFPEKHPVVTLIFPLTSPDPVGPHHGVYYQLLGTGVRVDLRQPTAPPGSAASAGEEAEQLPAYKQNIPTYAADFRQYLVDENVRFVLVAQEDPEFAQQFASWFDRPPQADFLYRVDIDGDQVHLVWIG